MVSHKRPCHKFIESGRFRKLFYTGLLAKSLAYVSSALREKEDKKKRGSLGSGKSEAALRLRPP